MTISEVIELVPEDKREEARQALEGLDPFKGIQDAEGAVDFIRSNEKLKRGYDKIAQQAVESHKRKFEEEKLPELRNAWKDEVRRELNPEETPEQKRLRELEEQLRQRDEKERRYQLKDKLRAKAKELGFDEELAEQFVYMQTDDHDAVLSTFAERTRALAEKMADEEINKRWPTKTPRQSAGGGGNEFAKMTLDQIMTYAKQSPEAQAEVIEWQKHRSK
jgi:hypothetical protein